MYDRLTETGAAKRLPPKTLKKPAPDTSPAPAGAGEEEDDEQGFARHASPVLLVGFVALASLATLFVLMTYSSRPPAGPKPGGGGNVGGIYNATAPFYSAGTYEVGLIAALLTNITNGCTPPPPPHDRGIYNVLKTGTLAQTRASWALYKDTFNGTGPGDCIFYGLDELEERTGLIEGPADICHAYVSATLQFFAVTRLTGAQQANLFENILTGVLTAFPLNMYFQNSLGLSWQVTVANQVLASVTAFTGGLSRLGSGDVQTYATGLCNPYFAVDQPGYYLPQVQPYLAFPFQNLVNKLSKTFVGARLQTLLGDLVIPEGLAFKAVYYIDPAGENGLPSDPGAQLFVQTLLGGTLAPVTVLTTSVAESLITIVDDVYAVPGLSVNVSRVPVLVIGRYVDDAQAYQTVSVLPNTLLFALSPQDPTNYLQGADLGQVLHNAASFASMSVLDFDEAFAFEAGLGPAFAPQKFVADAIAVLMDDPVFAGTVQAQAVLDTFEAKNVLVNGVDVGGRLAGQVASAQIEAIGLATGLQRLSFSMQRQMQVGTPGQNATTAAAGVAAGASVGSATLPTSISWTTSRPDCMVPVRNQGSCNDCWAIASSDAMSTNLCLQKGVPISGGGFLSTQQIVTCSIGVVTNTQGCAPQGAFTGFTMMEGDITSEKCQPYASTSANAGGCQTQCRDGSRPPLVGGVAQGSTQLLQTPADIKAALQTGPLAAAFTIPADFATFFPVTFGSVSHDTRVYPLTSTTNFAGMGQHMVLLTGYNDAPASGPAYWEIQNSWGTGQCNAGVCFMAQATEANGASVIAKSVIWFDNFAIRATPRLDPTTPAAAIESAAAQQITSATQPGTLPAIYSSQVSCPTLLLNAQQSAQSAAIQGCPNSAAAAVAKLQGAGAAAAPEWWLVLLVALAGLMAAM